MDDLIQRLRDYYTQDEDRFHIDHPICDEAADEIERLRASLREWQGLARVAEANWTATAAALKGLLVQIDGADGTAQIDPEPARAALLGVSLTSDLP